ncbi:MAG: sigma-70 family RNA polymerase sigma factor [Bacteroidales bacterium]|nr:sigma-70 family RNA polymerase sigma factor [Bacteroidales bacterium]
MIVKSGKTGKSVLDYSGVEDLELVGRAKGGEDNAFAELVRRYQHTVAKTVIGMLGGGDDAEDVGQQVFIRFYRALDDFRGDAALATYLTRIAINLSLNELKRRKRMSMLFLRPSDAFPEPYLGKNDSTETDLETEEVVNKALQQLEPKFRSVVVLRMMQGYSTKETSRMLKLPMGTVLSRLSRAQDKLKELLKDLIN